MTALSSETAFAELWYTMQAVRAAVGVTPTCWRPPYGDVDDRIRSIAKALGLRTILWAYDSDDWKNGIENVTSQTVDANYGDLIKAAQNGTFNSVRLRPLDAWRCKIHGTHSIGWDNYSYARVKQLYDE